MSNERINKKAKFKIDYFKFGLDNSDVNKKFGSMYNSFFSSLRELGCEVNYVDEDSLITGDFLVVPVGGRQERLGEKAMKKFKGPFILYVPSANAWFRESFLKRWQKRILFVYGWDSSNFSVQSYAKMNIKYFHIPAGSDPFVMKPLNIKKKYDVVFVASATSGQGRHKYMEYLMRISTNLKKNIIGTGWEQYGFSRQLITWGNSLNEVYNEGEVCINVLNDEQKLGVDKQLDANNRLFDLAMAGCFQICNAPQVVRQYFDENEVVAIDDPKDWSEAILYYLNHPEEKDRLIKRARIRALKDHTWSKRSSLFLEILKNQYLSWEYNSNAESNFVKVLRYVKYIDRYDVAHWWHEVVIRKVKKILKAAIM